MKLIIGLGNPGKEYERTRHNVGWMILDTITNDGQLTTHSMAKLQAEVAKGELYGKRILLAKPQTFMNNSGQSVRALLDFYKLSPTDIIVVHDDKDIPLGETRVQKGRGAAGHNGVLSIFDHLGTKDFWRIRVGVAPVEKQIVDTADFVLKKFTKDEQRALKVVIEHVVEEIKKLLING